MTGSKMRLGIGAAVMAATLAGSVVPASARGYGGGWGGSYRPYHRDRGLNAGDVIGIAALIGAVAVIASSAAKDREARDPYPDRNTYPETRPYDGRDGSARSPDAGYSGPAMSADQAADACAVAVRDKVEGEQGGYAQILDVAEPRASGQEGWSIDGRVERRAGARGDGGEIRRFSCDIEGERVAHVYISRDAA